VDDGREITPEQLLAALRALTAAVRTFVDYDGGLSSVISDEQMRRSYDELLRVAEEQGALPSDKIEPGQEPTTAQHAMVLLSIQVHSLTILVMGMLTRTGIRHDIQPPKTLKN
jgi:hypothetical protein